MSPVIVNTQILDSLKARGMKIHRHSPTRDIIFENLSDEGKGIFYSEMKHYSVRLILRDMIKHQDGFTPDMLGSFSVSEEKERCINLMYDLGIVEKTNDLFRLKKRPIRSFGPTLEWFVARLMEREFASPSVWGIRFKGISSGGDFDVISQYQGELVYIEVKSAPPKGIEVSEAASFLKRINSLLPRAAFFFVDTELRMRDRVVLLFHQEFLQSMKDPFPKRLDLKCLEREIFHINHRIFILNSARDVVKNFTVCLRDFLANGLKAI